MDEINSIKRAAQHFFKIMNPRQEELWISSLTPSKQVISSKCIFRGTMDACLIHPRDIIFFLCCTNASSFLMAHNHPSGELWPSEDDIVITQEIKKISSLIQIPLIDHLLISQSRFISFKEKNWFV